MEGILALGNSHHTQRYSGKVLISINGDQKLQCMVPRLEDYRQPGAVQAGSEDGTSLLILKGREGFAYTELERSLGKVNRMNKDKHTVPCKANLASDSNQLFAFFLFFVFKEGFVI